MRRYWIATVSKEHVELGKAGGFAQVCHGKCAPLKRMHPGDILIYYSAQEKFSEKSPYQCFTALGIVIEGEPYQVPMTPEFIPYRRDIDYLVTYDAPIRPLISELDFIKNKTHWGSIFRYGMIKISVEDFLILAKAMRLADNRLQDLAEN
jgi:hypothetical protein